MPKESVLSSKSSIASTETIVNFLFFIFSLLRLFRLFLSFLILKYIFSEKNIRQNEVKWDAFCVA